MTVFGYARGGEVKVLSLHDALRFDAPDWQHVVTLDAKTWLKSALKDARNTGPAFALARRMTCLNGWNAPFWIEGALRDRRNSGPALECFRPSN